MKLTMKCKYKIFLKKKSNNFDYLNRSNEDSKIANINLNLSNITNDYLSHLNLKTIKINFVETFGDVKVIFRIDRLFSKLFSLI
jgi:hypothetical protein